VVLEAVAEFAATLVSPLAGAAVLVLAFALERPALGAVGRGGGRLLMAVPNLWLDPGPWKALAVVPAAVMACLLQAELCLFFVLPAWRLACALAAHLRIRLRLLLHRLDA
jgi:hypothetical protein